MIIIVILLYLTIKIIQNRQINTSYLCFNLSLLDKYANIQNINLGDEQIL